MTNRDIVLTHGKIYVKNEYTGDYNQNDEGKFTAMFMRCDGCYGYAVSDKISSLRKQVKEQILFSYKH